MWLSLLSCRILCCFTAFEAIWKHFERVSAGGGVPLEKNTRLAVSESNHRTAKAKIFPRNERSRFKSRSAESWITRFPVRWSLVYKSHRNGLKIPRLPAQICLSRCCIMRIANGCDTRFENRSLETASAQQKPHLAGVGGNHCLSELLKYSSLPPLLSVVFVERTRSLSFDFQIWYHNRWLYA